MFSIYLTLMIFCSKLRNTEISQRSPVLYQNIIMLPVDLSIWCYINRHGPGAVYNHVWDPEAMCDSVKLVSLNDLSVSCLIFNVYKLYSFTRTWNQYTDSKSYFLTSQLSQTGQWAVTQSMIVALFCRYVILNWVGALFWLHLTEFVGSKQLY